MGLNTAFWILSTAFWLFAIPIAIWLPLKALSHIANKMDTNRILREAKRERLKG